MKFIIARSHFHIIFKLSIFVLLITNSRGVLGTPNVIISSHDVKITATMNYLGDFAEALLGEHGDVQSIVTGSIDPHFFEPSANDLINLQEADVILAIGNEEIDQWLTDFIEDNDELRSKVFNVIDLEVTLEYDPIIDAKNPHFWLSPINALTMIENIKNHFVELQLVENDIIDANYLDYKNQLQTLLAEMETQALIFNGTKVVVDHPAFYYFLNLLGFERMGAIEEREGVDASPFHIQELRNLIKNENVELIIASKTQAGPDVDQLAADTGIKIAFLTPLPGIEGAESYTELISYNLNSLNDPQEPKTQDELPPDLRVFTITILSLIILRKKAHKTN